MAAAMQNLSFHLEGVVKNREEMLDFSGPLTLILMLLSKTKIVIRDIQISLILEQYLDYITEMREMDLEVASEFVQMASHLVYIKTKMLLSGDEEISELELLISSLEQIKNKDAYLAVKTVIPKLAAAYESGIRSLTKPPEPSPHTADEGLFIAPGELLAAAAELFARMADRSEPELLYPNIIPGRIVFGVREKSRQILELLRTDGEICLSGLFSLCASRSELVATFVSILELCGMGGILLTHEPDDDIRLQFTGGDVEEIIRAIGENHDAVR
jgi:segregation and condensation protein A